MPFIETYYDYDIHKECFRVSETANYTHTTDTILKLESISKTILSYMTATFNLDVIRNIGDGKVGIYDNRSLIRLITFNENTTAMTDIELDLNYNVSHNIEARYLGNDECLASKSMVILINEDYPDGFETTMIVKFAGIEVTGDEFSYLSINTSFRVDLEDESGSALGNKTVILYITNSEGETTSETISINSSGYGTCGFYEDFGIYDLKIVYNGDSTSLGVVKKFRLFYGYQIVVTPRQAKWLVGQKPIFDVLATTYEGVPLPDMTVSLWEEEEE